MKAVFTYIKKLATRLLTGPKAFIGAIISLVILIGGLIQSVETFEKHFPGAYTWLKSNIEPNITTILTTLVVVLLGWLAFLLWLNSQLQKELREKALDEGHKRLCDKTCKLVLFISPDPAGAFYLQYFSHLVRKAAQKADSSQKILITILCPSERFESGFIPETSMEMASSYPVQGVFMIPAAPDEPHNRKAIVKFQKKFPTVLLDVYLDEAEIQNGPYFVGGHEIKGGESAAALALDYFKKIGKGDGLILIILGRSTKWEMQRVNSFRTVLQERLPQIQFALPTDYLHYKKEEAKKEIEQRLYADPEGFLSTELIFACNDEMAIGAYEALDTYCKATGTQPEKMPKIIGYDGTDEMRSLIEKCNPYILGTVDVRIAEQADQAIATMKALLKEEAVTRRYCAIDPKQIRNQAFFRYKR